MCQFRQESSSENFFNSKQWLELTERCFPSPEDYLWCQRLLVMIVPEPERKEWILFVLNSVATHIIPLEKLNKYFLITNDNIQNNAVFTIILMSQGLIYT